MTTSMDRIEETYPALSMMRFIHDGCQEHPEAPLLITEGDDYTYSEIHKWAVAFASYLNDELELKKGSSVILSAPNTVHVLVVLAAAQLLDIRVALMATTAGSQEFERSVNLVRPGLVISADEIQCQMVEELAPNASIMAVSDADAGRISVDAIMRMPSTRKADFPDANADAPIVVFTSGSTGVPKAIVNRASSFALNGAALCKWLELTNDDVIYLPVPLIHVFGLVGIYATLTAHAAFATSPKYDAEQACALMEKAQATVHFGVPTNYIRELKCNEEAEYDLNSLRAGLVAGADCPPFVIEQFERLYGCTVVQSYGMSETAATLTITPLTYSLEERISTVGFCIKDAAAKADPVTGEIMCKSASMMEGVLQEDGSIVLDLDDGWYRTGDVGCIDENGLMSITGRVKDVIVRGGINIFPSEIESVYEHCGDVAECCVTAFDDAELGHRIFLAVVLQEGSKATADSLREYAKGRIDKCKLPDVVRIVDELPCLGNGKVDRSALRARVQGT